MHKWYCIAVQCTQRRVVLITVWAGISIVQRELDAALAAQKYEAAVAPAMWVVMCYRFLYGAVHPLLSLHLLTLVGAQFFFSSSQLCLVFFNICPLI